MFRKLKIKFNVTISLAMISVFIILYLISYFKCTDAIKKDYINKTLNITTQATDGITGDMEDTELLCRLYLDRSGVFQSAGKNSNVNAMLREAKAFSEKIDGAALLIDGSLYLSDTYLNNYVNLITNSLAEKSEKVTWAILSGEKLFLVYLKENGVFVCDIASSGFFGRRYNDNIFMQDANAVIEKDGNILSLTGGGTEYYEKYGAAGEEYRIKDNTMIVGGKLDGEIQINYYIPLTGLAENIKTYRMIMNISILVFAVICILAVRFFVNRIVKMMSELCMKMNSYIEENQYKGGRS